jgi:hypothetical protein
MSDLDRLVGIARAAAVPRAEADAYVRDLERWARTRPVRRIWVPWAVAAFAFAAALAIVVVRAPGGDDSITPTAIGDRVAIVAAPAARYRVAEAGADATRVVVECGTVTARLWHAGRPHRLVLEGGGVVASATGTVYSLTVREQGAVVHVDRGTVEVQDAAGVHVVAAGASWPAGARPPDPRAASVLLALADREPVQAVAPADAAIADAVTDAAPVDAAPVAPPARQPAPAPTVKERWRHARLLRAQGKYPEAVEECVAIAATNDPVWGPIALVEAIRIEVGPLSDPARAVALADQMLASWPHDPLAPEARSLRCRALAELGRGGECDGSAAR